MHAIDYFCSRYEITNTDLATLLGVKQPQVASWKSGKRNIPQHHREEMLDIFNVPKEESHMFDIDDISESDRAKVSLFLEKAKLKNYLENIKEDNETVDKEVLSTITFVMENNIKLAEGRVEIVELVHELSSVLLGSVLTDKVLSPSSYKKKLNAVRDLINEIKMKK